jgi:hypothetical protein
MKLNNRQKYADANRQPRHKAKFRVEEAKERQDYNDTLSPQQKLERLDVKLGKGVGAVKQRARLAALMEAKNNPKPVETKPNVATSPSSEAPKKQETKKYMKGSTDENR